MSEVSSYFLVDGENIDRTLGQILDAKPRPNQRPRWQNLCSFVADKFGVTTPRQLRSLFFLNVSKVVPGSFIQALVASGYTPVMLEGPDHIKVVDAAIIMTLEAIAERETIADVCLASHDRDFVPAMLKVQQAFCDPDDNPETAAQLAIAGFSEYVSGELSAIEGIQIWDLEREAKCFDCDRLPRNRTIHIDAFDPLMFI